MPARWRLWDPLRGRVHHRVWRSGIVANLEAYTKDRQGSLLILGALLARYDGTEVLLKPVSGTLADRVGARPVLLGGLAPGCTGTA